MRGHLVGAHGMYWDRELVDWEPGAGRSWQMLGTRGGNIRTRRVCDFRNAAGIYILYDPHGARYTGIARGSEGLGGRLKNHHKNPPHDLQWNRFSWFTFDAVEDSPGFPGWCDVHERQAKIPTDVDVISRDIEALLIKVLGFARSQNDMKFLQGFAWDQLHPWDAHRLAEQENIAPWGFAYDYWHAWDIGPG